MGELSRRLQDPLKVERIREEGGFYEYGDLSHMFEDLVAIRRMWGEAVTIVPDRTPYGRDIRYKAFWDEDVRTQSTLSPPTRPQSGYLFVRPGMPVLELQINEERISQLDLAAWSKMPESLLAGVESEARRLGDFSTEPPRPSIWSKLAEEE